MNSSVGLDLNVMRWQTAVNLRDFLIECVLRPNHTFTCFEPPLNEVEDNFYLGMLAPHHPLLHDLDAELAFLDKLADYPHTALEDCLMPPTRPHLQHFHNEAVELMDELFMCHFVQQQEKSLLVDYITQEPEEEEVVPHNDGRPSFFPATTTTMVC